MKKPKEQALSYPLSYSWLPFTRYYSSGFVALPDPGGFFDQDADLMQDFHLLAMWVNYHIAKLTKSKSGRKPQRRISFEEMFGG